MYFSWFVSFLYSFHFIKPHYPQVTNKIKLFLERNILNTKKHFHQAFHKKNLFLLFFYFKNHITNIVQSKYIRYIYIYISEKDKCSWQNKVERKTTKDVEKKIISWEKWEQNLLFEWPSTYQKSFYFPTKHGLLLYLIW